jgi:hypothetical protein
VWSRYAHKLIVKRGEILASSVCFPSEGAGKDQTFSVARKTVKNVGTHVLQAVRVS